MSKRVSFANRIILVAATVLLWGTGGLSAAADPGEALVRRVLPQHYQHFKIETIETQDGRDVFEIESEGSKIVLRGNNGISIASGLNWYLKYYCHAHISWCGSQLNLPTPLPQVSPRYRGTSSCRYRYTFNYCTYGYTMAFWDWPRWEREIDYMALNGINLPLSAAGMECVIRKVYLDMGLTEAEIGAFISGPAFLPWFHMGNLDGWGGPLPKAWYAKQELLQKQILARQRALGMKAVLPAFAGHVPASITRIRPNARVTRLRPWGGFDGTYVLAPDDPLFKEIGGRYISTLKEMYGTDHYYSADTFNEMDPPTEDLRYLADISRTVYDSMAAEDPSAVWVMQGWLFLESKFWRQDRINALLSGVADDRMIILDLFSTAKPQWTRTNAYSGKPWIWCMLHNWGGKQGMYGRMQAVAGNFHKALQDPKAGRITGLGSTQEGNDVNPIVFDLLFEMAWRTGPVNIQEWTVQYVTRRYGKSVPAAQQAWAILLEQLYTCPDQRHGPQGSYLAMSPTLEKNGSAFVRADIFYDTEKVRQAFRLLLAASDELKDQQTYQFDLVDLGRQVMSDLSQSLHADLRKAYGAKDADAFAAAAKIYLQAIKDTDQLLLTNEMFLAGRWLGYARDKAATQTEARLYEWNARDLITLWGGQKSTLHDYAQRQYGGMMGDFNYTRWKMFLHAVETSLKQGNKFDHRSCQQIIRRYEEQWTRSVEEYPSMPVGDPIETARVIADRYCDSR
jgi:alpha-N-acetylglucosaminidase